MSIGKANIPFYQDLPTVICPDCNKEFIILEITRYRDNPYEFETVQATAKLPQRYTGMYCPNCSQYIS